MAKTQDKGKKQQHIKSKTKKIKNKHKAKSKKSAKTDPVTPNPKIPETTTSGSTESNSSDDSSSPTTTAAAGSGSNSVFDPSELRELLEPFSKEQLVELVCFSAQKHPPLLSFIRDAADGDVTHRKIFVHGLAWEATRESLVAALEPFGEIEECNVIKDKATGKTKGYGFVLFKTRKGAREALKEPKKKIHNRIAFCQLASVGPIASAKGLEITGPVKISSVQAANHGQVPVQSEGQQVLSGGAVAAPLGQNMPLLGQHPGLNLVYGTGLLGSPALTAGGGYINPLLAGALCHGGFVSGVMSQGLVPTSQGGGVGGLGGGRGGLSLFGSYVGGHGLQNPYPNSQIGQLGADGSRAVDGSFPNYPSYMWEA